MRIDIVRNWVAVVTLMLAGSAMAQVLTYTRTDLPDGGGGDAWQYSYTFAGMLQEFGGLNLIFSPTAYANLSIASGPPVGTEFFDPPAVIQPDAGLGADGLITLTALASTGAGYSTHFVVSFEKTGNLGDSHPFEVFDNNFNVTAGTATLAAPVPEPSSVLMLACGIAVVGALYRRRLPSVPSTGPGC